MSKLQWRQLHDSLKRVLKKNNKILVNPLLVGLLLNVWLATSCTLFREKEPIEVMAWFSLGENNSLNISAQWDAPGNYFFNQSRNPYFEKTIEYHLVIRNKTALVGRLTLIHLNSISYDPYTRIYYLGNLEAARGSVEEGKAKLFIGPTELRAYLQEPVHFTLTPAELLSLGKGKLTIYVRGYISRLSKNSPFQRWLLFFPPHEHEGYGRIAEFIHE